MLFAVGRRRCLMWSWRRSTWTCQPSWGHSSAMLPTQASSYQLYCSWCKCGVDTVIEHITRVTATRLSLDCDCITDAVGFSSTRLLNPDHCWKPNWELKQPLRLVDDSFVTGDTVWKWFRLWRWWFWGQDTAAGKRREKKQQNSKRSTENGIFFPSFAVNWEFILTKPDVILKRQTNVILVRF